MEGAIKLLFAIVCLVACTQVQSQGTTTAGDDGMTVVTGTPTSASSSERPSTAEPTTQPTQPIQSTQPTQPAQSIAPEGYVQLTAEGLKNAGVDFDEHDEEEWEGYDGWYNNLAHPDWGGADLPLTRRLPVAYEDGVFRPAGYDRPTPMNLSRASMFGPTGRGSFRGRTALMTFFGQQVVEEILDAQRPGCPPEYFNMPIPDDYEEFQNVEVVNRERLGVVKSEVPLLRSRYSFETGFSPNVPREQLNEITPWFDGGLVYGISKAWADALREFHAGRLRSNAARGEPQYPEENTIGLPLANPPNPTLHKHLDAKRFFKLGNPRGNENPFLLTFGIVWFRWHNIWAKLIVDRIEAKHKDEGKEFDREIYEREYDEYIFNEARKWVIATYQKIVYYDWLPVFLNLNEEEMTTTYRYEGYKGYIHPGVTHEFQSAAMRFGHTLVPPGVYRRNDQCEFRKTTSFSSYHPHAGGHFGVRTCNSFWNPQKSVREFGVEEYLMGMASQVTEREDNIITEDLQRRVFGPLDFSRRDLMAVNIQRGRDHGLPDYNTARVSLGLARRESVRDIVKNASQIYVGPDDDFSDELDRGIPVTGISDDYIEALQKVLDENENLPHGHNPMDKLDIWPGGIMETTSEGPGELFRAIILDQFIRLRDADRFWFERDNGRFTKEEIAYIHSITFKDVFVAIAEYGNYSYDGDLRDAIQDNPFLHEGDPCANTPNRPSLTPSELDMENCTYPKSFDYFGGSQVSYALSYCALGLSIVGSISALIIFAQWQSKETEKKRKEINRKSRKGRPEKLKTFEAEEWQGYKKGCRPINVMLGPGSVIKVNNERGTQTYRTVDLSHHKKVTLWVSPDSKRRFMTIKLEREYDLVLRFADDEARQEFISECENFLGSPEVGVGRERMEVKEKEMLSNAITKEHRQRTLEKFFRHAFASLSQEELDPEDISSGVNRKDLNDILTCELTKSEFAEMLSMKPDSVFVEQMFDLIDKDMSGAISFREFLDVIVIFAKGKADEKLKLMFDMYDLDRSGHLSRDEFKHMLKSMMDIVSASVESERLEEVVHGMFSAAGFEHKEELSLEDFISLMAEHKGELERAQLQLEGADVPEQPAAPALTSAGTVIRRENAPTRARKTIVRAYGKKPRHGSNTRQGRGGAGDQIKRGQSQRVKVQTVQRNYPQTNGSRYYNTVVRFIENYKREIFVVVLYNLVLLGVFAERAYYYSIEREFAGLRTIAGYGVTVTRGAASAMMFTYSSILVTMSRNTITYLRETFLHRFIAFDFFLPLHKMIAFEALAFSILHTIGHSINFYHISSQPPGDLTCLFRNFWHRSNELPKFHYWAWATITGFTGILCVIFCAIIFTFALQYSRRKVFKLFWLTHNLWVVYFILMILHGSGRLVQPPFFYYFVLGPLIWYTLDKLVSISRNKAEITVTDAQLLPSDVTMLEFKRPVNFDYKSGQWVRIACKVLGGSEYHPFTLTSAPHEENLSLHIRAVGPWTINLRKTYDPNVLRDHPYPKLYLDGPYGEGHQDWYQFEVSVLVGGGIGVTPFASILKDIVYRSQTNTKINCKKVYFIWVTRTQKHFEWLTEIIRDVEEKDEKDLVSVHIFITQFFQKFDLRTTMLYICERHFQKISNRSLFTGLQSITHFGRPQFESFLGSLQDEHPGVSKIGVFSCGPPGMTSNVEKACVELNKYDGAAFMHHFENF